MIPPLLLYGVSLGLILGIFAVSAGFVLGVGFEFLQGRFRVVSGCIRVYFGSA